jgi:hypothetical protein
VAPPQAAQAQRGLAALARGGARDAEYIDEQNHLPAFFRDCYALDPMGLVAASTLQQDYSGWCAAHGEMPYDYQRKVVPFLRSVMKLVVVKTKAGNVCKGLLSRP